MTSYKELGLVNTREMFAKAVKGGYAIPAYNFNNMEQMQAIISACVETKSPVILQVSKGARDYANMNLLRNMAKGATEYAHELGYDIPIVLHLDPWWNVAAEEQATDRAYRIGQKRPVSVVKLICHNSIEEKVVQLQENKRELYNQVIKSGDEAISRLNIEDIKFLLS